MCVQSWMVAATSSLTSRLRTSLVVGASAGTLIAAWMMSPRHVEQRTETAADDGMVISARLVNARILPGTQEHNLAVTLTAPAATGLATGRPPLSLAIVIDRSGSMHGPPIRNARD